MLYNFRDELLIVNDFGNSKILECESLAFCRPINSCNMCNKPVLALVFLEKGNNRFARYPRAQWARFLDFGQ